MKQIELIGPPLYQWDTGRRVHIALQGVTEAHFAVAGSERALVVPVVGGEAVVPSLLLAAGVDMAVWASDGRDTHARAVLKVRPRAKPDGYIYTDDEVKTWADVEDWVREQLKSAGEPGTKWYVGGGTPAIGGRGGDLYLDSETGTYYRYGEMEIQMANAWNQVGTLMGPQGPRGATGATGAKGGSVRVANIDVKSNSDVAFSALKPADGVQVDDVVIDANGDVYAIASVDLAGSTAHVGEAVEGVSVKGPQGPKGDAGEKGADGTSITVKGAVADKNALPADAAVGDTYVTSDNGHMWVKTSMSGDAQWTDLGEMKGPKGDRGEKGATGDRGEKGATGAQGPAGPGITFGQGAPTSASQEGAVYIDTADGFKVYQYGQTV